MTTINGLIPARFLCLTGHLIIIVTILWSRDENVKAGLPLRFSADDYDRVDTRFVIALCFTLVCLAIEYFGFFGGFSTFMPSPSLLSTCFHSAACIALAFFIWDVWDSDSYCNFRRGHPNVPPEAALHQYMMSMQQRATNPAQQGYQPQQQHQRVMAPQGHMGPRPGGVPQGYAPYPSQQHQQQLAYHQAQQQASVRQAMSASTHHQPGIASASPTSPMYHTPQPQQTQSIATGSFAGQPAPQQQVVYQRQQPGMGLQQQQVMPNAAMRQPPISQPQTQFVTTQPAPTRQISMPQQQQTQSNVSEPMEHQQTHGNLHTLTNVSIAQQQPAAAGQSTAVKTALGFGSAPGIVPKPVASTSAPAKTGTDEPLLTAKRLDDLVKEIDPNEQLDDDVKDALLHLTDEFVDQVCQEACEIAKHRNSNVLEAKDIQFVLQQHFNIWIPGFGGDELRPTRRAQQTDAHKQRMELIRKTLKK